MDTLDETQPAPIAETLGQFAEASISLAAGSDEATLRRHAEQLARLTGSDLILMYEGSDDSDELNLVAQWGLPNEVESKFKVLGSDHCQGAGGLRSRDEKTSPLTYDPLTQDLLDLGIRAYWAYPLWSEGELIGQLFFGSRNWDKFHRDTLSVFAATTIQVSHTLQRRKTASAHESPQQTWGSAGGRSAANKRRQFIAILAHELRNPIAPIRSGLDLIATGLLGEEARRSTVQMMQRQVAHLVRLIDDLLDTVRLDTGKLQIKRQPVVLRDVVKSAIESIRPALSSKSQALRLEDEAAEVVVDVDPVRLAQAFVNILSTNVKDTPEGGVVTVSVTSAPTELSIEFEDEGPGVNAKDIDNIFELFPQSAAQKSDDGLGIGLALVKGLVELNDGTVDVRNREAGNGAIYRVRLPASSTDIDSIERHDKESGSNWASHLILIVDDNRDAADTLGLLFELDGHTVRLAHDGVSAVSEAKEFQPAVILMDIGLPGLNGHEATRRIRAQRSPVRPFIIALTGWGASADREASQAAGCDMHLVKPVSHEDLRKIITRVTSAPTPEDEIS